MHHTLTSRFAIIALAAATACGGSGAPEPTEGQGPTPEALQTTLAEVGLDPAAIDSEADPCSDFFQYACGGWLASHEIPADKSAYGRFYEIQERNEKVLRELVESQGDASSAHGEAMSRVRDFYGACMNEEKLAKADKEPIEPLLAVIDQVKNPKSLQKAITELHKRRVWALWSLEAEADFIDPTTNILFMDQAGLGLPDRDYYTEKDERSVKLREFYLGHLAKSFELIGYPAGKAKKAAKAVMALETRLAKASRTAEERRDPEKLYNRVEREGLEKTVPRVKWAQYFAALGAPELKAISITSPAFFEQVEKELKTTPIAHWRHYLKWHVFHSTAPLMAKKYDDQAFALTRQITGQKERRPRWKRCLSATNESIGELLAQPYIDRMFPGNSKTAAENMVKAISSAFERGLAGIDWMSPATKKKAEEKRGLMAYLIGYPSKWKTYDFEIEKDSYAGNVLRAASWELSRQLAKVGKPYDREEWFMVPQRVNAYYNPLANQMVFPAGILQKPFFDEDAGVAVNLGAMGMIVGHELTHGFDDQGSKFDAHGKMTKWWQPQDFEKFESRGECVVAQYAAYEPLPGEKINGKLTLGENIADIGGVKLAYRAYKDLRAGKQPIVADRYTEDQQFFLAVGQAWCSKYRDEVMSTRLRTDPHSPAKYRVNGALANQPEFAEAFSCDKGTPMNPENSCEVW